MRALSFGKEEEEGGPGQAVLIGEQSWRESLDDQRLGPASDQL